MPERHVNAGSDEDDRVSDDRVAVVEALLADAASRDIFLRFLFKGDEDGCPALLSLLSENVKPETVDLTLSRAHPAKDANGIVLADSLHVKDSVNADFFMYGTVRLLETFHDHGFAVYGPTTGDSCNPLLEIYQEGAGTAELISKLHLMTRLGYFSETPSIPLDESFEDFAEDMIEGGDDGEVAAPVLAYLRTVLCKGPLDREVFDSLEGCPELEYLKEKVGDRSVLRCTAPAKRARTE